MPACCLSVAQHCIAICSAASVQNHELDALPESERNLEASMQDVQAKLELIKQLQPLWLRSCRLSLPPPLLSAIVITVLTLSSLSPAPQNHYHHQYLQLHEPPSEAI